MSKDNLGKRIKENYEDRTRIFLPRRTYSIIRLDGKAFHSFTKGMHRPYDVDLMNMMDETAKELCRQIQGAKFAYIQSDEISILLTDFEKITTSAWFDGVIQKIVSVSASIATVAFNQKWLGYLSRTAKTDNEKLMNYAAFCESYIKVAYFDSRVFTVPDRAEVANVFIWRQIDATKNSLQMAARSVYSHKELDKKNLSQIQELLFQKGINWNDYPVGFKRGRLIVKEVNDKGRSFWKTTEPPIFTSEEGQALLKSLIPKMDND